MLTHEEPDWTPKAPIVLLYMYIAGVSEEIQPVAYDVKTTFEDGRTLCSLLTRAKDPLLIEKNPFSGIPKSIAYAT